MASYHPPIVTRTRLKWAGSIVSPVLLVLFLLSHWVYIFGVWNTPTIARGIQVAWGGIGVGIRHDDGELRFHDANGIHIETSRTVGGPSEWWFAVGINHKTNYVTGPKTGHFVFIPLWFPFLLVAVLTAWLWRTDRRAEPWQCATCRYDLRGIVKANTDSSESCPTQEVGSEIRPTSRPTEEVGSEIRPTSCPECGTPITSSAAEPKAVTDD